VLFAVSLLRNCVLDAVVFVLDVETSMVERLFVARPLLVVACSSPVSAHILLLFQSRKPTISAYAHIILLFRSRIVASSYVDPYISVTYINTPIYIT